MLTVSVIVPVYNAARHLTRCLEQLSHSLVQPLECILVDDGSTDSSMAIARRFPVQLLSTGGRLGPAYARNLGARHAQGAILLFLDSDVCVHPDTVERVRREFERSTDLDALIGSYDELPDAPNFISQYKNLQHCFVHQHGREGACTFWAGCGGIRRDVFLEFGGFDEGFARPSIEDIELGYRLRHAGRKLALNRDIQVKHLKRWTLWNLLKTDIFYRGVPWTELTLSSGWMPDDLNLRWPQ